MRKVSKKRAKQLIEYSKLKEDIKEKIRNLELQPICFYCRKRFDVESFDIHHLDGREEDKLTDLDNCILVHRHCHNTIHFTARKWLEKDKTYRVYLVHLRMHYPNMYLKELNSLIKAGIISVENYNLEYERIKNQKHYL